MAISNDDLIVRLNEAATEAEADAENFEHTKGSDEHRALHIGEASAYRNVIEILVFEKFISMLDDEAVNEFEVAPRELEQ